MPRKNKTAVGLARMPKKAKQVSGNATKLKKLGELKKVNAKINEIFKAQNKRFEIEKKLYNKRRKLQEQLGIE